MRIKLRLLCVVILMGSFFQQVLAQTFSVTGNVKNKTTSEALIRATVSLKGTTISTVTDQNGNFSITAPKGATLIFTYTGLVASTYQVNKAGNVEILMEDAEKKMDEVIIIGYGVQKVTKVSGAISTVKGADIEKLNPVRAEDALQGRATGVTVISSGSPGAKPTLFIRGITSYSGNDPIVVVDGSIQSLDDLNSINSADIESINVLKDASTTAIFGVKGGNGVIVVTTKSGRRNQKTEFTLNTNYGRQEVLKTIGVLNASEYGAIINEGSTVAGGNVIFNDLSKLGTGVNWQDEIFKNSALKSSSITAKGGSEKMTYFLSGGYLGQDGIVGGGDKSYFNRVNGTANLNFDLTSKIKFIINTSYTNIKGANVAENGINSVIANALNFDPTVAKFNTDPNIYGKFGTSKTILSEIFNPLTQLDNTYNESNTNKLYGKLELQYDVLKNLKLTARYGYTNVDIAGKDFYPLAYYGDTHINSLLNSRGDTIPGRGGHNSVSEYKTKYYNYTLETFANYNFKIRDAHHFETVIGFSMQKNTGNSLNGSRQDVPFNSWEFADLSSAQGTTTNAGIGVGSFKYARKNLSFFGRINYDYKDKYLVSFSGRQDGSYAFGINNKFASFFAGSLGWLVSNESFFKPGFISYLKIRGSYGSTGNENVKPQYQRIATGVYEYGAGNNTGYPFGSNPTSLGSTVASFKNDALKWEKQIQSNAGFDMRFFKNKFSLTADYFQKSVDGILFVPSFSLYLGTSALPTVNIGSTKTSGFDISLGYADNLGKKIKISTNLNFSATKNLVTESATGLNTVQGGYYGIPSYSVTRFEKGFTPGYFYGYKTDGLFQSEAEISKSGTQPNAHPGDIRFADVNKDGKINDKDRTQIGDPFPKFTIGWSLSVDFKGFDLSTFVYASVGNDVYRAYERNLNYTNKFRGALGRWTGEGSTNDAKNPRFSFEDNNLNTRASDRYIEDGSFVKIKNIQLGYTVPSSLYKSKIFSRIHIYAQVKNAFTFTKYTGFDPEIAGGTNSSLGLLDTGIDRGAYPQARTYSMGIDFKF